MSQVEVPVEMRLLVDPNDLPPGPAGKSAYEVWLQNGHVGSEEDFLTWLRDGPVSDSFVRDIRFAILAPGVFTDVTTGWAPTGLECTVNVQAGERVMVDVAGGVSHTAQNMVHFTLMRNEVNLAAPGLSGLACVRIDAADTLRTLSLKHGDAPPTPGPVTYALHWRNHNISRAYLGRRFGDEAWMIPTTMSLTVYKPTP